MQRRTFGASRIGDVRKGEVSLYFEYGDDEITYLKGRDKRLGEAIDRIGHVYREVDRDRCARVAEGHRPMDS